MELRSLNLCLLALQFVGGVESNVLVITYTPRCIDCKGSEFFGIASLQPLCTAIALQTG